MKRTIPLLITAISGLVLLVAMFVPAFQRAGEDVAIWFNILASIAFILGGANLFRLQLQQISDRQPGWGFSAVTLISFVAMLLFGLLKVQCPPEPSMESYGQTAVYLPLSALPRFSIPLTVPATRGDGAQLPRSVRSQIATESTPTGPMLSFAGWMNSEQVTDLTAYLDTLAWKCQIEQLASLTQVPPALAGKVRYDAGHQFLFFAGYMTDDDRTALLATLPPGEAATQAVDALFKRSHAETSLPMTGAPAGFAVPSDYQNIVEWKDGVMTVRGPVSPGLRDDIALRWTNDARARPQTEQQLADLLSAINAAGNPLNEKQTTAFRNFFASSWDAASLGQLLNTAGISKPRSKTACELMAEIQNGNADPDLTVPGSPAVMLNAAQVELIEKFVASPEMTPGQLLEGLIVAGELTAAQQAALTGFFQNLPTQADQHHELCMKLLAGGPLSKGQKDLLLQGARAQFYWRQQIGRLFLAAHQVKYPWSGDYSAQGSPFWWLYEYVLQPLMTTTFALLAFYVASAAFRAFRAKNMEAILLLGTAFIILLGRTPAGPALTGWIPNSFSAFRLDQMTTYIMSIFNTAGNRAIMIGVALGTISTSLKVLLGIDRSYLGKGDS